ncbi:MAG TPA: CopG family transcriptional regulator [Gemmatimonadaceae bacterium]|nr:CopG family transcriptional regulator [Gemmatimonadaceae bacterium]
MKRTSLFLDEQLLRQLKRVAARRGVSFATVVREAMAAYVAAPAAGGGALPSVAGKFSSGRSDTSARVDELLWKDPHK